MDPRAHTIIAIDGPAASGKSSAGRLLAERLGLAFLDTGAMYRAVALRVLEAGGDPEDGELCTRIARSLALDYDAHGHILIDGQPGEPAIRAPAVSRAASPVALHPGVRAALVAKQQELGQRQSLVAEGRDTTTVVFPFARPKFFLWATPRTRAQRRAAELGEPERVQEIEAKLAARDERDSTRAVGPLRQADDAIRLDTDGMSLEEVVEELLQHARAALEADEA